MSQSSKSIKRSDTFSKIAKLYNISPKQVKSIVAYHAAFRRDLGSLLRASRSVNYFETREGNISKGIGFFARIAAFFTGGVTEVAAGVVKGIDQFKNEHELTQVSKISTVVEDDTAGFVKNLATESLESQIDALKDLTPEQANKRAKNDIKNLKSKMIKGHFEEYVNESDAHALLPEKIEVISKDEDPDEDPNEDPNEDSDEDHDEEHDEEPDEEPDDIRKPSVVEEKEEKEDEEDIDEDTPDESTEFHPSPTREYDPAQDLQEAMWREIGNNRGENFLKKECVSAVQEVLKHSYEDYHPDLGNHTHNIIAQHNRNSDHIH